MPSLQVRVRVARRGSTPKRWYAARLRLAVLTDRAGLERFLDSVTLLQAPSRDAAFDRALILGREREQDYRNHDGTRVRWGLVAVASLDEISEDNWNGLEVLAIPVEADPSDRAAYSCDHDFQPERSRPSETRV